MKTIRGVESYGCFQLGNERSFAVNMFISLRGSSEARADSVISAELIKSENGMRQTMALIHCSYLQLGDNIKTITRELFKKHNLEP